MRTNWWWWEERMMMGCMYHVFRQYTLLWCVRMEEKPLPIIVFDEERLEQREERRDTFRALRP
jgi:hypothetical protein